MAQPMSHSNNIHSQITQSMTFTAQNPMQKAQSHPSYPSFPRSNSAQNNAYYYSQNTSAVFNPQNYYVASNWNNPYIQQQQYTQYYNNQWILPSNKYHNNTNTINTSYGHNDTPYPMSYLPPHHPITDSNAYDSSSSSLSRCTSSDTDDYTEDEEVTSNTFDKDQLIHLPIQMLHKSQGNNTVIIHSDVDTYSAHSETSTDDETDTYTPHVQEDDTNNVVNDEPILKNIDLLGANGLQISITFKKEDIKDIDEGNEENEGDEGKDEHGNERKDENKKETKRDSVLKREYEEYIKIHNNKKKKKSKKIKKKKSKKKKIKSPIYIEQSLCYDDWDLHEMYETEQMKRKEEKAREGERLQRLEGMERNKKKNKKTTKKKKITKKKKKKEMYLSKSGFKVRMNGRYRLDDGRIGICKYRGKEEDIDWIGIVLEYGDGEHNGKVNGIRYFRCKNRKGIMVRTQNVIEDLGSNDTELDAKTIYDTRNIDHLLKKRIKRAQSMYD